MADNIEIFSANEHNLKNVNLKIPRNQLVVFTGLSGSGKSSLAFDTIYAEGQRRYIESFNAYARQFLGNLERPDVERITGLSPVVAIEQKTTSKSPRSTVGTTTEIYDFLRLLFARVSDAYSLNNNELMIKLSDDEIIDKSVNDFQNSNINILAPLVTGRKGHYRELFEKLGKQGYLKVRVDGEIKDIEKGMKLDRYQIHDIELVIDRLKTPTNSNDARFRSSINTALKLGKGIISILDTNGKEIHYSRNLMCPITGVAYSDPEPNSFSFNSPYGACPNCKGLGTIKTFDSDKSVKDKSLSFSDGALNVFGKYKNNWFFNDLETALDKIGLSLSNKTSSLNSKQLEAIFNGFHMNIENNSKFSYKGIRAVQAELIQENAKSKFKDDIKDEPCNICKGKRLNEISLQFKIDGLNISELSELSLTDLKNWVTNLKSTFNGKKKIVADEILKEISNKIDFLLDVGLHYLSLNRPMKTLSGGESQRIRLASQIGSKLVGILYILDEPSIGLHQSDNTRLINSLQALKNLGNSIIVVEHDKEIIEKSDFLVDIGPKAGVHGGEILYAGAPNKIKTGITADYLNGSQNIEIPTKRKTSKNKLILKGASGNNLKNVTLNIPLNVFACITGVSGSGKSSLINGTLSPILYNNFYKSNRSVLPYKSIQGVENIDKIIQVDQSPIGRTPRSNPATYTGVFSDIRTLFTSLPESKIRGYQAGRFSFNVKGGRCEECKGAGMKTIEMNFLPDVLVNCESCFGHRYNRETLEVRYKGKSITDVLNMSIEDATTFFEAHPKIYRKLNALNEVGLGYISLGQPSTTLSGGEAQRIKLATELSKKDTGSTLYIFDEPTTGLHFHDIKKLLEILHRLVDRGNSVLVIEHNLDVIKTADFIVDLGPEGGKNGGQIVFEGTPEKISTAKNSATRDYLLNELKK